MKTKWRHIIPRNSWFFPFQTCSSLAIPIIWAGSTKILRLSKIHLLFTSSHILFFVKSCKLCYNLTTVYCFHLYYVYLNYHNLSPNWCLCFLFYYPHDVDTTSFYNAKEILLFSCSEPSNVFPSHLALNAQYPCIMSAMQRSLPLTSSPRPPHPAPCSLSSSHSGLLMFLTYSQFAFNSASSRTLLLLPGVLPRDSACLPASLHSHLCPNVNSSSVRASLNSGSKIKPSHSLSSSLLRFSS